MRKKVQVIIYTLGPTPCVLMLRTNNTRGGFWQNVTGGVDKNESFSQAAKRETDEETKYDNFKNFYSLNMAFNFRDQYGHEVAEEVFACELQSKIDPIISPEHQEFKWVDMNSISRHDYLHISNFEAFTELTQILTSEKKI